MIALKTEKKVCLTTGLLMILLTILALTTQNHVLRFLTDAFFMIGLFFIMIGALLAVFLSGFFDFFQQNMHNFFNRKKKQTSEEFIPLSQTITKQPIYWFEIGGIFLLLSLGL